jgi:hypothetical protein
VTCYLLDTNIISNVVKPAPSQALLDWLGAQPRGLLRRSAPSKKQRPLCHGRRRPATHDFDLSGTARRGWPACAGHDTGGGSFIQGGSAAGRWPTRNDTGERRGREPAIRALDITPQSAATPCRSAAGTIAR